MEQKLIRTELKKVEADDYSEFGKPVIKEPSDPMDMCLPGAFLDKFQLAQLGLCPLLMAQECAKNFNDKCEMYFDSLRNENGIKDFLGMTMRKKFCRLADNSSCKMKCQKFDPISENSTEVCSPVGNEILEDPSMILDVGLNEPVNVSPYYMSRCQLQCDVVKAKDVEENDDVIDKCIQTGLCKDVLGKLCATMEKGDDIKNKQLKNYCDLSKSLSHKEKFSSRENSGTMNKVYISITVVLAVIVCFMIWKYSEE